MATCPNCGNQTGESAIFCDQCGTRLPEAPVPSESIAEGPAPASVICGACGAANVPGEAFCDACGAPLEAPAPAVPAVEPEAVPAEVAPAPAVAEAPAVGAESACPACGAPVAPDDAFCDACGASLQPSAAQEVVEVAETPLAVSGTEAAAGIEAPPVVEAPAEIPPAVSGTEAPAAAPAEVEVRAEAPPAVSVAEAPPAEAPPTPVCPACGAEVRRGDAFCSSCGATLAAPAPVPVAGVEAAAEIPSAVRGARLVVDKTGAEIALPAVDVIVIGREDPVSGVYPEVDTTPHEGDEAGVSRRHALIRRKDGGYTIEDLDSTNFTFLNQQKLTPKVAEALKDGDTVRLGRLSLTFRTG